MGILKKKMGLEAWDTSKPCLLYNSICEKNRVTTFWLNTLERRAIHCQKQIIPNSALIQNIDHDVHTNYTCVHVPIVDIQDGCCRQNKQHRTTTAIY